MDTLNLTLVSIGVTLDRERYRMLRPENVDAIAESMKVQGQLQPIVVRPRSGGRGYWLIAGWHRLEAAKKLKWETIRCEIREGLDDDQAGLIEVDENLIRAELSPAEVAMHTVRRKELYEKVHPQAKHGGAPGKAGGGKKAKGANVASFVKDTAEKTGQSKRSIERNTTRGKNVTVLSQILGTCLDTGEELDALAQLDEDAQLDLALRARAGEKVSARAALVAKEATPKEAADSAEVPPTAPRSVSLPKFITHFTRVDGQVKEACDYNPEDPGDVAMSDADTPEMIRHRIFMYHVGEALQLARAFEALRQEAAASEITEDIIAGALQAVEAWTELMSKLQTKREAATS
jgi:ParB-like nuclease domain